MDNTARKCKGIENTEVTGEMKITIEVDTNEDEEVLELIRRLVALLEKEDSNETI